MKSPTNLHGIIHGKTIELDDDPGLRDGQEVEVTLRPAEMAATWGEGLRRAAGAMAGLSSAQDEQILDQIQQQRQRAFSRELP
jgi:hypothetical protein